MRDDFQNTLASFDNVVVPESEHRPAESQKVSVALRIMRTVGMLTAVQLNRDPTSNTGKIGNIGANRDLSAKLVSAETSATEVIPKTALRVSHL